MDATADRPWTRSYAPGVPATIAEQTGSLVDLLTDAARRFGPRVALDFFGATTTYAELDAQVARAAEALRRLGVQRGDRVALVLPNCPQHVVAFYAVLRLGAVVVEHNPLYTAQELEHQLTDHAARVAVVWDKVAPLIRGRGSVETVVAVDLSSALPRLKRWALRLPVPKARAARAAMTAPAPGALSWAHLVDAAGPLAADHPAPAADDIALLQYTGGTTGTPKGAILSHRNLRANAAQGRAWVPGLRDGEETVYAVLPLFHAYGLTLCLTFSVSIGATLVLFPRFDLDQVLDAVRRRPPTFLPAVPPIYERLATAARKRGVDLTSVRYAISGAMALPPATVELWESVTGGLLVEGYGMTETSPITLGNPVSPARRPGTVGVPFPSTEIRIVDPEDPSRDRAPGEAGELLVRGPQVFAGYWQRPEETAAVLLPDGWLRTGDVVTMDPDGFVTVVDRIKELIITGGFNVYPSEVEDALRRVPGVRDAAAVGLPGERGGEEVVAAVVLDDDASTDPEAVRAGCRQHLAGYKVPRQVVVVADLPRSQIGKVLRREVRDRLLAER
ncbi:long-chain fatty acid--CoA ligase [Micromonospora globispora]|uniref:Long-chain fatty acid--CoA ligase n=2 Tax=Micromonospora globispora TaxID=1450148 RepID=A0A317JY85_9ACTN|nr:long-chain-fatty-acid--CoA ligase [Micromonospora globispora]PWU45721.1 long-chain fatty acid--CoA ligase [Micromonospora globispora]RQW84620.1 long-chain fatty acid--CoA ligase [Micromonospora globispora]